MEFRRHADKLMIGKVDKKKVWGRDGRMRIERVEDPSIAFALPPDEDKPRWVVSMKDSAKRPFRFVVKIKSAEEEETGETFVVQAFLRNPLELHVRDQGARESGWLAASDPSLAGANLEETLGECLSGQFAPTDQRKRWVKQWRPAVADYTPALAERLVVSARDENEAKLVFLSALNVKEVANFKKAFTVKPYDEETGSAFPLTMTDRRGRPLDEQVPPKADQRKGAKKPSKKAS